MDGATVTPETAAITVQPVDWQSEVQYMHDYSVVVTICFGLMIGLLCAILIKRG